MAAKRPTWVLLVPSLDVAALTRRVAARATQPRRTVTRGDGAYTAVAEFAVDARGGAYALGRELSAEVPGVHYALELDPEFPHACAYEGGRERGDLEAWPDDVAASLGCTFPGARPSKGRLTAAQLEPVPRPPRTDSEPLVDGQSLPQWAHTRRHYSGWAEAYLAHPAHLPVLVAAFDDPRAEVRAVALALAGMASLGASPDAVEAAIRAAERLEATERDADVKREIEFALEDLRERLEER